MAPRFRRTAARIALVSASLLGVHTPSPAIAATGSNVTPIQLGYGNSFWNYDFGSTAGGNSNVDWAISLLFYNNATVREVNNTLSNAGFGIGGTNQKWARVGDRGYAFWTASGGTKTGLCSGSHYRAYAYNDFDSMYTPELGYYVIASTHKDHNECFFGNEYFDQSEAVEKDIAQFYSDRYYPVYRDWASFANWEPLRAEGNHIWDNNGYGTYVRL